MIAVEGDTYLMGIPDLYAYSKIPYNEKPQHEEIVGDFYIGQTEVSQELWTAVMSNTAGEFQGAKLPVEQVSYNDCVAFIAQLNKKTGRSFRLPTEQEWEFAAKGGKKSLLKEQTTYACGYHSLDDTAWYSENSGNKTHAVGTKYGNELDIRDMGGNVWEWTSSHYNFDYEAPRNPYYYVVRGGCWDSFASSCRVTKRAEQKPDYRSNTTGFRLAMDI
ncbi:MAG: SUMF1/EgtB/PvdO family nonheme iron enzyme [Alloprevotella sp.]|nr:SUMF1/EgtB/PvdO family nonheme iron enzyme [Alloprevotella sp.]